MYAQRTHDVRRSSGTSGNLCLTIGGQCYTTVYMRSTRMMVRLTEAEAGEIERAASSEMLAASTWARVTLLTAARNAGGGVVASTEDGPVGRGAAVAPTPQGRAKRATLDGFAAAEASKEPSRGSRVGKVQSAHRGRSEPAEAVPAGDPGGVRSQDLAARVSSGSGDSGPRLVCTRHKRPGCSRSPECAAETGSAGGEGAEDVEKEGWTEESPT